jgi:hypothetical protein
MFCHLKASNKKDLDVVEDKGIVISIALRGYKKVFRECIDTQKSYCNRCGFQYVLIDEAPRHVSAAEAAWLKIALLCSALKSDYDWVAFLDADCEVRKETPCFSKYLGSVTGDKSIFVAPGFSGRINSGVIFARSNTESIGFFEQVINSADQEVPEDDKAPYENGHMIYHGSRCSSVYLLDHHLWNNNSEIDEESYIQHYSGGKLREWFMKNRAPRELRVGNAGDGSKVEVVDGVKQLFHRVADKASYLYSTYFSARNISDSIDELMSFYEEKYPVFSGWKRSV